MHRYLVILGVLIRAPIVVYVLSFNVNLWMMRASDTTPNTALLDGLTQDLRAGAGEDMQEIFPEGYAMTHFHVGFASVNEALDAPRGSAPRAHALNRAREMVARMDTDKGREIFPRDLEPAYGAFYRHYLAWLRGGILLADPGAPQAERERFQADCQDIARALRNAQTPFIESYHGQTWPADGVYGLAALALHDALFAPRYRGDIQRYVTMLTARLDPQIALPPHSADPKTGEAVIEARGLSSAVMSRMMCEVDPVLGKQFYERTRTHFVDAHMGILPGVFEHRDHRGGGDIDSGPLLLGISGSASAIMIGAAHCYDDDALADALMASMHAVGVPLADRYGFGVLPVGEAIFESSRTSRPWAQATQSGGWSPVVSAGWRFVWHLISLLLFVFLISPELRRRLRRRTG